VFFHLVPGFYTLDASARGFHLAQSRTLAIMPGKESHEDLALDIAVAKQQITKLPPKSSIREIRINQNPFSAEPDKLGYGRIEILTKPGTDKLHGMLLVNGNDSAFNSLNTFTFVSSEPAYYSTFLLGNVSGSFSSRTSWFFSGFRRDKQANSIINAQLLNTDGQTYDYIQAVSNPQMRLDLSPRLDVQLTKNNTTRSIRKAQFK